MRKFYPGYISLPQPSGVLSVVDREGILMDFDQLLLQGFQEPTYLSEESHFGDVIQRVKDSEFLEDGTELEAYMQLTVANMLRRNSILKLQVPPVHLSVFEPVSFGPTDIFCTEFEAYTVTERLLDVLDTKYTMVTNAIDPERHLVVAYSDGLFSGRPGVQEGARLE